MHQDCCTVLSVCLLRPVLIFRELFMLLSCVNTRSPHDDTAVAFYFGYAPNRTYLNFTHDTTQPLCILALFCPSRSSPLYRKSLILVGPAPRLDSPGSPSPHATLLFFFFFTCTLSGLRPYLVSSHFASPRYTFDFSQLTHPSLTTDIAKRGYPAETLVANPSFASTASPRSYQPRCR